MKLFDYTKWEVLETYQQSGAWYFVQVRMNKKTGFKYFKTTRITSKYESCYKVIEVDTINKLTPTIK